MPKHGLTPGDWATIIAAVISVLFFAVAAEKAWTKANHLETHHANHATR